MYYKIACEHADLYKQRDIELAELESAPVGEDEIDNMRRRFERCYEFRENSAVIAVTFAGMALEAFFYDYAAEKFGDAYVTEHLDRLDIKSKFLIYPLLVCGKGPSKSDQPYANLVSLVRLRNDLVHFKSRAFRMEELDKASDFHVQLNERLKTGVVNAVNCVQQAMKVLDELHGTDTFFELSMRPSIE